MSITLTLECLEQCLIDDGKTVITTLTNSGYLLYTLNMLKSLKPYNLDKKILIVCIDINGTNILRNLGYTVICVDEKTLGKYGVKKLNSPVNRFIIQFIIIEIEIKLNNLM